MDKPLFLDEVVVEQIANILMDKFGFHGALEEVETLAVTASEVGRLDGYHLMMAIIDTLNDMFDRTVH